MTQLKKRTLHERFKNYRNLTIIYTRVCKEDYYKSFFQDNKKDSEKNMGRYKVNCECHKQKIKKQSEKSFFLSPILPDDIEALISTLKVHKVVGPGSIPTIILKQFKKLLSKPLANLINLSFSTGLFPKILKQAKIIPIFKRGD